jgi:hypothetical protein
MLVEWLEYGVGSGLFRLLPVYLGSAQLTRFWESILVARIHHAEAVVAANNQGAVNKGN